MTGREHPITAQLTHIKALGDEISDVSSGTVD